ncbi:MAG: hypothetical protein OXC14_19810 [Rhodospirillaceae bacterium]|nr:hypothetical protein [Rhodospirillaceae bacterium]
MGVPAADIRARVERDNLAGLMQELAKLRAAAGLGEIGVVPDYRYEFPEHACTCRRQVHESFIGWVRTAN